MLIDTKFNIGDTCYIVEQEGFIKGTIIGIKLDDLVIGKYKEQSQEFILKCAINLGTKLEIMSKTGNKYYRVPSNCYKCKKELINYIQKSV